MSPMRRGAAGIAVAVLLASFAPGPGARALVCGTDGKRVEALYLYEGRNDARQHRRTIRAMLEQVPDIIGAEVRYARNRRCRVKVRAERGQSDDLVPLLTAMESRMVPDRKYVVFTSGGAWCGHAYVTASDSRPGPDNVNNAGGFALVARSCWSPLVVAHELTHTFGAVMSDAPHSDGRAHVTDEGDLMSASGIGSVMDVGRDDYFDPDPPPGSYLDTHWNVARSGYLEP